MIFDGYSRAIVGAGYLDRQTLSRLIQVFRQAIERWGAPEAIVSDHGAIFVALQRISINRLQFYAPDIDKDGNERKYHQVYGTDTHLCIPSGPG